MVRLHEGGYILVCVPCKTSGGEGGPREEQQAQECYKIQLLSAKRVSNQKGSISSSQQSVDLISVCTWGGSVLSEGIPAASSTQVALPTKQVRTGGKG